MTSALDSVLDPRVRLHVVTGKGGTGKTTLAAALAVALASSGRRVLLTEVEGRSSIAAAFDIPPIPEREELLLRVGGGEVYGLSIEAKSALIEYLRTFYKLGRAGSALEKLGAIDFATTIAPGVRDILLIGKVFEAVRRKAPADGPRDWAYDAVVLDAPPTGRVVQFLNVSNAVGDLARMGPIHSQSKAIMRLLRSQECAVHITTLLEEMPVQETADAVAELREAELPVGAVLVNQAQGDIMSDAAVEACATGSVDVEGVRRGLRALGLPDDEETARGLIDQGRSHSTRLALEDSMLDELDTLGRPVLLLPRLLDPKGAAGLRRLADEITAQAALS
ncbi:MAG: ArsA-related P-loop ATPase [Dermatophilus congolensis]|nr:ArsA-related P-loop ATPase [Dermatophilus congolensis]